MYPYEKYKITCPYKKKGKTWKIGYHLGVDFVGENKEIRAISNGVVISTLFDNSYGNKVVIEDSLGNRIYYCHLSQTKVYKGDKIKEGQVIGVEGSTGNATGSHLHLEIRPAPHIYGLSIDPIKYIEGVDKMKYTKINDTLHIVELDKLNIKEWDKKKKTSSVKNYANAGFFAVLKGGATIPVGNLAINGEIKAQCTDKDKYWTNLYNKKVSTFIQTKNGITIEITDCLDWCKELEFAITGIPMVIKGREASVSKDIKPQGWFGNEMYATWHGFLGIKNDKPIYLGYKSSSKDGIGLTHEMFMICKKHGISDLIKLDGGGSFVLDINGKNVALTSENRRINNLILFNG